MPPRGSEAFATVRDDGYGLQGAPTLANAALDPDAIAPPELTAAMVSPPEPDANATMRIPPNVVPGPRTSPGHGFSPARPVAPQPAFAPDATPLEPADALGTDPSVAMPADERTGVLSALRPNDHYPDATTPSEPAIDPDAFLDSPTIALKTVGEGAYDGPATERPPPTTHAEADAATDEAAPEMQLNGQLIAGRYRATRLLGEGGMGVVYAAVDERLEKPVAIKVLKEEYARRADVVARFTQEAKSAAKIKHENVLQVTDHGKSAEGLHYIAMELLNGTDLADVLQRDGTVSVERGLELATQVCRALAAAHEQGVVHRDLKPENVFLVRDSNGREVVKIVDFGIAQLKDGTGDGGKKLTRTGMIFGTPEYMSPEQASGKPIDHRVDVYAVGVILYEMFAGRVPFVGDTFMGVLTQHMFEQPPPLAHVNPQCAASPELEAVIFKALAKDPAQRYASMSALAEELNRLRSGQRPEAPPPVYAGRASGVAVEGRASGVVSSPTMEGTVAPVPPPPRRKMGLFVALAVSALAGLAVAYTLSTPTPTASPATPPVVTAPPAPTPVTAPPVRSATPPTPAQAAAAPTPAPTPAAAPTPEAPAAPATVSVRFLAPGVDDATLEAQREDGEALPAPLRCEALPCTRAVTPGVPLRVTLSAGRRRRTTTVTPARDGQDIALELGPAEPSRTRPASNGGRPRRATTPPCGQRYPGSDLLVPCI
jgi:tRNA A-37 threonylcarbamoyl transferase component Bud32